MSPLYEYRCEAGHRSERVLRMEEEPTPVRCDKEGCPYRAYRIFSTPAPPNVKGGTEYFHGRPE